MISGRLVIVKITLGFGSKVLVILGKCSLKIFDSLLPLETLQSLSEIILLLEQLPFSKKCSFYSLPKVLIVDKCLGLPLKNILFSLSKQYRLILKTRLKYNSFIYLTYSCFFFIIFFFFLPRLIFRHFFLLPRFLYLD